MKIRHFLSLKDWSSDEIDAVYDLGRRVKDNPATYSEALRGKSLAMVFQKPSTRTRVSFEVGMFQLGGMALYLGSEAIQLHRGEPIPDTARVLSRYADAILARVFAHQDVLDLAKYATVPVINGLSDLLHPLQALADFFTLRERLGGNLRGKRIAYVGDGNNTCHELMIGAVRMGMAVAVASPEGFEPNQLIVKSVARDAARTKVPPPLVTHDPREAVKGAVAVYTDVWTSMGQENESDIRTQTFQPFRVTPELMAHAKSGAFFMHCLPAHRGEEVDEKVIDGPTSLVIDQAENRMHTSKALLMVLLGAA